MLNNFDSSFDSKSVFDVSLIVVLCSIMVSDSPPSYLLSSSTNLALRDDRAVNASSTKPSKQFHPAPAGNSSANTLPKAKNMVPFQKRTRSD